MAKESKCLKQDKAAQVPSPLQILLKRMKKGALQSTPDDTVKLGVTV